MRVYKIVREINGKLRSVIIEANRRQCGWGWLKYKEGEVTRAHKGSPGIFCFESKKAADSFAFFHLFSPFTWAIYSAEGIGEITKSPLLDGHSNTPSKNKSDWLVCYPGVVTFPAIRLLERVE